MVDDPDDWLLGPWVYDDWLQEKLCRDKEWHKEHRAEAAKRRMLRMYPESKSLSPAPPSRDPVVREARWEEFKDNPKLRKWAMWREYKAGGTTLKKVGENFGITPERVRQSNAKCDRMIRRTLDRAKPGVPASAEVREATRGVEFVFCNGFALEDTKGWQQLELTLYGSASPIPAYTYYKIIIPKEQTNDG